MVAEANICMKSLLVNLQPVLFLETSNVEASTPQQMLVKLSYRTSLQLKVMANICNRNEYLLL